LALGIERLRWAVAMQFLPTPRRPDPEPPRDHPACRWLLFASAAAITLCCLLPWVRLQAEQLWGSFGDAPGWQSSAGFTCLCTGALVLLLAMIEDGTPTSQRAVRPGSMMLVAAAGLALLLQWHQGPGTLRGIWATWTAWFYAVLALVPLLLSVCLLRWRIAEARPE
jgi:hypothetical protein